MATVKLAGSLPNPDSGDNGLDVIADALVAKPHQPHLIVGILEGKTTTIDHTAKDAKSPTAHLVAIEVAAGLDADVLRELLAHIREARTGQKAAFETTPKVRDELANRRDEIGSGQN